MASGGFNVFGAVHVDGVEIKLSDRTTLPPKVSLPRSFQMGNPTEVLFMEYDFSLEEGVLAWCDKQKEAVAERQKALEEEAARQATIQAAAEEARRLAEEEAEKTRQDEEEAAAKAQQQQQEETSQNCDMNSSNEGTRSPPELEESGSTLGSLQTEEGESPMYPSQTEVVQSEKADTSETHAHAPLHDHEIATQMTSSTNVVTPHTQASTYNASSTGTTQQLSNKTHTPVMYGSVGGILLPQPAQTSVRQQSTTSNASSAFDPKDFENNELDPFETVELKTLDDMAELNKVLQGVHVSQQNSQTAQQPQTFANPSQQSSHPTQQSYRFSNAPSGQNLANSPYVSNAHVTNHKQPVVGMDSNAGKAVYNAHNAKMPTHSVTSTSVQASTFSPSVPIDQTPSVKEIGYPDINLGSNYGNSPQGAVSFCKNSNSVSFQKQSYPGSVSYPSSNPFANSNPSSYAQSGVYNNSNVYGGHNGTQWPQNRVPTNPFSMDQNNQYHARIPSQQTRASNQMTTSTSSVTNFNNSSNAGLTGPISNHGSGQVASQNWTAFGQSSWQPNQQSTAVPQNGQRWQEFYQKTSPDSNAQRSSEFEKLKDNSGSKSQSHSRSNTPVPHTSQQELRGSKSTSDLATISGGDEAAFQTTPPTDVVSRHTKPLQPGNSPENHVLSHSLAKSTDPYREMSGECQRLVNRIADMGFLRLRVAHAVQKLGQNDKKVLDYLCGVNRLCEKGFTAENAENAMALCSNDENKAHKFLTLQKMFHEFGFSAAKIQEGLLKNDLDEEKTLDWLTSSNC